MTTAGYTIYFIVSSIASSPRVAPTPAQIAAAQGQPVVMTQQKASNMMGEDGGTTWSGLM